jgi:hypothetical protein
VRGNACKVLSGILEGSAKMNIVHSLLDKLDKHFFRSIVNDKIYSACQGLEEPRHAKVAIKPGDFKHVQAERQRVMDVTDKETCKQRCRRGTTPRSSASTSEPAALRERARVAAEAEYDTLLECGYELVGTFMILSAHDSALMKGIQPQMAYYNRLKHETPETREEKEREIQYEKSYKFLDEKIKRVEFEWHGGLNIAYFPLCDESQALNPYMIRKNILNKVSIDSPDLKKRDFLRLGQEVVDEMFHLFEMRKLPGFILLQDYYTIIRQFAFLMVIFLNLLLLVTVQGPGNGGDGFVNSLVTQGEEAKKHYAQVNISGEATGIAIHAFQGVIISSYSLCLIHQARASRGAAHA